MALTIFLNVKKMMISTIFDIPEKISTWDDKNSISIFFVPHPYFFSDFWNKEIQKIGFQPRKDQKNVTSKNDLKSRLGALNEKLWPFFYFFIQRKTKYLISAAKRSKKCNLQKWSQKSSRSPQWKVMTIFWFFHTKK